MMSPEIYPSLDRLSLIFIGTLDSIFGVILLIVSLQKSIFNVNVYLFILLSWAGGISLLKAAKQPNINNISIVLKIGFIIGLVFGMVYLYFIIKTLRGI